jgi:hypothetical protein
LEIAERHLAQALEAKHAALEEVKAAKAAFDKKQADMARARVDVLDRFVGKPTRRVGVNDLFMVLKDQDDAVEDAAQTVMDAQQALELAEAHVTQMSDALKAAKLVQQKRNLAFQPVIDQFNRTRSAARERDAEEEFGHARRF